MVLAENEGLKQNLTDMTMTSFSEQKKFDWLQATSQKVGKDLQRTQDFVLHQHELDFNKALKQATFFYGIP